MAAVNTQGEDRDDVSEEAKTSSPSASSASVTEVEELAEALCRADDTMHHHDATDDFPCWHCTHKAERLAPWLAAYVAQQRAEAAERERDELREREAHPNFTRTVIETHRRCAARLEAAERKLARVEALAGDMDERGKPGENDSLLDRQSRQQIREDVKRIRAALRDEGGEGATDPLPLHRTEAGYPRCSTCDGGGCPDCTDPS